MTAAATTRQALRFALEGERVRKASGVLEREATPLASALRRAVPFLARRGIPVTLSYARATPIGELLSELPRPLYALPLIVAPGGARGALVIDANAIASFVDGALGGNGEGLPTLNPSGLSAAQTALVARIARGIVGAFSEVLVKRAGLRLTPGSLDAGEAELEGALVACGLEFGEGEAIAHVVLLLPKEALLASSEDAAPSVPSPVDPRTLAVLADVELEVVAELGRVPMKLGDVAALRVGDTLRLDIPVGGTVTLRADGHALMRGRPSTEAGRIVVRVDPGHER